jgi:Cu(I)/Ag(I) efflux system membrane protein CusA/SilA
MIRGRGYVASPKDVEDIVLGAVQGTPILIKDVAKVVIGPDIRRGTTDLNGEGEVVSGIVIARQGSNAIDVIDGVKNRLKEIAPGLPQGVKIVPIYDRSVLIRGAISNARITLIEVILTVALIICIFLWHFPSARRNHPDNCAFDFYPASLRRSEHQYHVARGNRYCMRRTC